MSEQLPEPALPIFGDRAVHYTIVHPTAADYNGDGTETRLQRASIKLDDIDAIEDPRLRGALWNTVRAEELYHDRAMMTFAKPDGRFSHAFSVHRGRTIMPSLNSIDQESSQPPTTKTKTAGRIAQLFRRMRQATD